MCGLYSRTGKIGLEIMAEKGCIKNDVFMMNK